MGCVFYLRMCVRGVCAYACVCMYICMYVCMCMYVCVCVYYACMCASVHVCMCVCVVCVFVCQVSDTSAMFSLAAASSSGTSKSDRSSGVGLPMPSSMPKTNHEGESDRFLVSIPTGCVDPLSFAVSPKLSSADRAFIALDPDQQGVRACDFFYLWFQPERLTD